MQRQLRVGWFVGILWLVWVAVAALNLQIQSSYNLAKPDVFGGWNLRVQLQLLFPKRR